MSAKSKLFIVAMTILLLGGCASSDILVGKARTPTNPAEIKIYSKPPKNFEEIALIDASRGASFAVSAQGKMDVVVKRLKAEAARLARMGFFCSNEASRSRVRSVRRRATTRRATPRPGYLPVFPRRQATALRNVIVFGRWSG